MDLKDNIKNWYIADYDFDTDAKIYLNPNATFEGLFNTLNNHENVYTYIFIQDYADSFIRENIFSKLADLINVEYNYIYNLFLQP